MTSGRTRPMRASASSSARCLAAICSDGCACCSVQPPQTPKCGQRGDDARRAGLADPRDARDREARLVLEDRRVDALAGQRAFDEHGLAVDVRDAATFLVERFDRDDGVGGEGGGEHAWLHAHARPRGELYRRTRSRRAPVNFADEAARVRHLDAMALRRLRRRRRVGHARRARGTGAFRAPAAAGRRRARRGRLVAAPISTPSPSAPAPARSPACASRAASRRDWRSAPTCRWCRCRRWRRSRRRRGACTGATRVLACLDARMREVYVAAYARVTAIAGRVAVGARRAAAGRASRYRPSARAWFGAGDGFAGVPDARGTARPRRVRTRRSSRMRARSPSWRCRASRPARRSTPAHALPLYVRHRVALTTAERDAGMRL